MESHISGQCVGFLPKDSYPTNDSNSPLSDKLVSSLHEVPKGGLVKWGKH